MPSKNSRIPKKRTKTFTGCWTCRSRGLKCDGQKPRCDRCCRSKRDCEGYGIRLHWMHPDDKGPPQGMQMRRLFDDKARQNPTYPDAFLDHTLESLDALQRPCDAHVQPFGVFSVDGRCSALASPAASSPAASSPASPSSCGSVVLFSPADSPAHASSPFAASPQSMGMRLVAQLQPYLVSASREERFLFDHWSSTLSAIFLPTPHPDNPFRNVFIPLALGSGDLTVAHPGHAALLHAMYAISAFHMGETDPSRKQHLSLVAIKHYKTSLAHLRRCVADTGDQPEAVFATIIIMASIYLVIGSSSNWRVHVKGARDWLASQNVSFRKGSFAPVLYQLFRCLDVVGHWHNNDDNTAPLGTICGGDDDDDDDDDDERSLPGTVTELPDEDDDYTSPDVYCLDRYFGLPKPIFNALQSMHRFRRAATPPSAADMDAVESEIEQVQGMVAALRPSDGINERLLVHHYMVFYYACRINLAREFRGLPPGEVQDLVAAGLLHLELTYSIERTVGVCGISWPLFVVACEAEGAELRERVFRMFAKGWQMGIGSIKKASKVVERVWAERDRTGNWDTAERQRIMKSMGMDLLLA
ncbi:arginine metabolism regulation protein ii [Diplodia corticola]|uniref:Arginine metabolism regulation protein ii n=1 Tax=Diplodia corticola TaxID=236234 RepID=A0A1J9RAU7_9PEZI|nr:arginine metabolism regulation protein ii [Diplodia corticola]OJD29547.1 arginine metabolism regulation protein ii [Diplodia corticola]